MLVQFPIVGRIGGEGADAAWLEPGAESSGEHGDVHRGSLENSLWSQRIIRSGIVAIRYDDQHLESI